MKWRLAAGWLLAVVATTAVAWQIVAVADEQVGDAPVSPIEAAPPSTSEDASAPTSAEPTTTTSTSGSTTSTASTTSTSKSVTTSSNPEGQGGGGTSSTTSASPTTASTSTTSGTAWATRTVGTKGGTVVVSYRPGEVRLDTAVPLPGFQVEIEKPGPPEVDVEFESADLRVRVEAGWDDGSLEIDVEESSDDD